MQKQSHSILRNTAFLKYFIGTGISAIGNGMQFIGISWFLFKLTGSTFSMGWLLATTSLSGILFSPWIGVLIDKWDRRITCMISDLSRGLIILLIPLLYYSHHLSIWMIYCIVFFVSIGDRFYLPASGGLVREIVNSSQLLSANSLSSMFNQIGLLIGTSLSGLIIAYASPVSVMFFNAFSFLISALCTFLVRKNIIVPTKDSNSNELNTSNVFFRDFREGVTYLKNNKLIVKIASIQLILYIALYTSNVLLPVFTGNVLGLGSKEFGLIDSAWAAGAILGGILLISIVKKIREDKVLSIGMCCLSGAILLFLSAHNAYQAVIGYFLMGLFFVSTRINTDTMIQSSVETRFQGRVKSTISMFISYISFTSYLCVGYLGENISLRILYLCIAIIILIGGVYSLLTISIAKNMNRKSDKISV
ncbi:MFS transporter [Niallia sp. 03133]|uniref:MFS transporter n=1 Tax=Niallia sp. 03133 TaxID=3458060 RepID=UPI004043B5F6